MESFQIIAKTFQGLEEVSAQATDCIRGTNRTNELGVIFETEIQLQNTVLKALGSAITTCQLARDESNVAL